MTQPKLFAESTAWFHEQILPVGAACYDALTGMHLPLECSGASTDAFSRSGSVPCSEVGSRARALAEHEPIRRHHSTRYPVRSLVPCATTSAITSRTALSRGLQSDSHSGEMAECGPKPGTARRYLADRSCPGHPPPRRPDKPILGVAVGFSARPAQGSACRQFPFRGSTVPGRSLSGPGIIFL